MMRSSIRITQAMRMAGSVAFMLLLVLCVVPAAMASDESPNVVALDEPELQVATPPVASEPSAKAPAAGTESWVVATEEALSETRGGASSVVQRTSAQAVVSENTVGEATVTGNVQISDAAISDVNGVFSGTFNTGNNVSIQSNLNVTIEIQ